MKEFDFYLNGILEIIGKDGKSYKSRIQEINKMELSIDIPIENGKYILLNENDEVKAIFYKEERNKSYKLYSLKFKVLGREIDNTLRLYRISWPYEIKKLQRRSYVRVVTNLVAKYKGIGEEQDQNCTVVDLSGGGMKIKSKVLFKEGEKGIIKTTLNNKVIELKGVVRRAKVDENKNYLIGFEFLDIGEVRRDKVIEAVFSIMRKQMEVL